MLFKYLTVFSVFFLVVKAASVDIIKEEHISWTGGRTLNDDYQVSWKYETGDDEIIFEIKAKVTGYVALGITTSGSMEDADIFMGWVTDGVPHLKDCHGPSNGNSAPIVDVEDNLELISGKEEGGETTVRFKRKLRTCDPNDQDIDISSDTTRMIWATSDQEPDATEAITGSLYHGSNRGHINAYLLTDKPQNPTLPTEIIRKEMRLQNVTIPNSKTTYWCDLFKIDKAKELGGKRHHLIMSDVIIGGNGQVNKPYIHHLLLYRCNRFPEGWTEEVEEQNRPEGGDCFDGGSELARMCTSDELVAAWAVGSEAFYFPQDVGLPVGMEDVEYYILEMHYDNPSMSSGIVDNSGAALILTPTLRPQEAGVTFAGSSSSWWTIIPPGQKTFEQESFCHMNCTQAALPEEGVNIFAGLLHTHLLGTGVTLKHFRGDNELPYILQDTNYDFNYQDMIALTNERKLLPGDALAVECIYDSTERDKVTYGGLGTPQEMCLSFVFYYPRSTLPLCISTPPFPEYFMQAFPEIENVYENPNEWAPNADGNPQGKIITVGGINTTWTTFLDNYEWTDEKAKEIEKIGFEDDRYYDCSYHHPDALIKPQVFGPLTVSNPYIPPTMPPCSTTIDITTMGGAAHAVISHVVLYLSILLFVALFSRQ